MIYIYIHILHFSVALKAEMSWFDTAGIASFAKSALTTAQKTIDKALDIQEEAESKKNKTTKIPGF